MGGKRLLRSVERIFFRSAQRACLIEPVSLVVSFTHRPMPQGHMGGEVEQICDL